MEELVLIRGLPGTGKSTLAASMHGYTHLETDQYFMKAGRYVFDKTRLTEAHQWCLRKTRQALLKKGQVVVSNPFTQRWEIKPYLDLADLLGLRVKVIELTHVYANKHEVPEYQIQRMQARWESI